MADLIIGDGHRAFTVTAHLAGGIASAGRWGIALDGLLAAEMWSRHKAMERAAGRVTLSLVDSADPPDMPLPLSRCVVQDGQWHWAATCAEPLGLVADRSQEARYWTGRMDERIYRQTARKMPATLVTDKGRWRNRVMPVITTLCAAVTWRGVGDPVQVRAVLDGVAAIGKKRSQGEGHVTRWEVEPVNAPEWEVAHLHHSGNLGRPVMAECVAGRTAGEFAAGVAGIRPPYKHPSRQAHALTPTN